MGEKLATSYSFEKKKKKFFFYDLLLLYKRSFCPSYMTVLVIWLVEKFNYHKGDLDLRKRIYNLNGKAVRVEDGGEGLKI